MDKRGDKAVWVVGLTRRFGSFVAVDDVSFDVSPGEIFGFLGPNGAGKSTTIRMLCGLLEPSSGDGEVGGYDIYTKREAIKRSIGYMSQKFSLYPDLTVEENVEFFGGIYDLHGAHLRKRMDETINIAGLTEHRRKLTGTLAGGYLQRLALGCAVLHEPKIIFLDEPTSGVDPVSRRMFWDLINGLASAGVTVFVTTHYMEEAEYCDHIAMIYQGRLIALDTPGGLKTNRMQSTVLNIECAAADTMMPRLQELNSVRNVALFGAGLHVVTDKPDQAKREIAGVFQLQDSSAQLTEIQPSLEDVFISLIEEADAKQEQGEGGR